MKTRRNLRGHILKQGDIIKLGRVKLYVIDVYDNLNKEDI